MGRSSRFPFLTVLFLFWLFSASVRAFDFGVDPGSPQVPGRSPSDIHDRSGGNRLVSAGELGLNAGDNIDAMSYGHDQVVPLGPFNFVFVLYSVDRGAVGHRGDGFPGGGAVNLQSTNNGAAGDKFFIRAIGTPAMGMIPISRGLRSDAPMHNLTPLPPPQSDIDQMAGPFLTPDEPIYFSVDGPTAQAHGWDPADILRATPSSGPNPPTPTVWASAATLGLQGNNIDALAIRNRGDQDTLDPGDTVWLSLANDPRLIQVFPAPAQVVLTASNLNLLPGEELNAVSGVDPGPVCDPSEEYDENALEPVQKTASILTRQVSLKPYAGSMRDILTRLSKDHGLRIRTPDDKALSRQKFESLGGEGMPVGDVLQQLVQKAGLIYEIGGKGDVVICAP